MEHTILHNPAAVSAAQWRALDSGGNPFMTREFHVALHETGCTGADSGWEPAFVALHEGDALRALATAYIKTHSYGEYVFDWGWASAYQRAGLRYYPKLVIAAPFSPVPGPRLLLQRGAPHGLAEHLAEAVLSYARTAGLSSVHWLFTDSVQTRLLERAGWLVRSGCQFHWHNAGYADFEDFLSRFSSKKRKNVKRERRQVRDAGVRTRMIPGSEADAATWGHFHRLYLSTVYKRGGMPYLTEEFFQRIGERMGDAVRLLVAERGGRRLGMALYFQGEDCLYGRYWGCEETLDSLHFECCYYAPIEYCIEQGIARFEAGAQGEHKLSRGLVARPTWSAHWLSHPRFNAAVAEFLDAERADMAHYMTLLDQHAPYRRSEG